MKKKGAWVVPVSGEKILIRKQDSGKWSFIGGSLQKKERPVDAALRVFHLETGQRLPLVELCGAFMLMDKGARCYYYPTTWEFTAPSGCKWVRGSPFSWSRTTCLVRQTSLTGSASCAAGAWSNR